MSEGPLASEPGRLPPTGVAYADILPLAITGSASMRLFYPEAGQTFSSTTKQIIRIPLTGAGFMDAQHSILRFTISVAGADAAFNGGAYSWINRLRIEGPDGEEIERIDNYNLLHSMLDIANTTYSQHSTVDSVLEGKNVDPAAHSLGPTITTNQLLTSDKAISGTANNNLVITNGNPDANPSQVTLGTALTPVTITANSDWAYMNNLSRNLMGGAEIRQNKEYTFTVKLASGLLNAKRYIPIGFIRGRGLTLELTLEDTLTALFGSASVTSYTIKNVQYQAHIMELSSEFNSRFQQMLLANGGIMFHGVSYYHALQTQTNTSSFNIQLPIRARSLKGILLAMREVANINVASKNSFRRLGWGLTDYQFFIGSSVYPQNPVTFNAPTDDLTGSNNSRNLKAEAYKEVMKVFARLNDVDYDPRMDAITWNDPYFMIGSDLERFPHDSGVRESGLNTASRADNIEFRANFISGGLHKSAAADKFAGSDPFYTTATLGINCADLEAVSGTVRFDSYGQMDVIYQLLPDGTFTSSY